MKDYGDEIKALKNRLGNAGEIEKLAERLRELTGVTPEAIESDKRTYRLPYSSDPMPLGESWD